MKINDNHVNIIYKACEKYSARNQMNVTKKDIKEWTTIINIVNSMKEDQTKLGEYSITDYEIPTAFKQLVLPVRVSLTGSEEETDFLCHNHYCEKKVAVNEETGEEETYYVPVTGKIISPIEFNEISDALVINVNQNKVVDYDKISLEKARKELSLSEAAKRATTLDGNYVPDAGWAQWPLRLSIALYKEDPRYGNYLKKVDLSVQKYLSDTVKGLKK